MDREDVARSLASYRGSACIMWGSWRIEGQASFGATSSMGLERSSTGGLAGTFVADSETESILLSALAGALHEPYSLRLGEEEEHREPIDIAIVGHEGNRIDFALRA
jgi:hypothetical protein